MHSLIRTIFVPLCPLVVAVWVTPIHCVSADDLFSEVALEAVFQALDSPISTSSSRPEISAGAQRVTGTGSLSNLLEEAGFAPQKMASQVVSVTLDQAGWTLPVLISVDVDQDRLDLVMLLAQVGADPQWDAALLGKLFVANSQESTVYFGFSPSRGRVELRRSMPNRGITPARLQQELTRLAAVAETYEDIWSQVAKPSSETNSNVVAAAPPASSDADASVANPTATDSLVGRWSASVGQGEAFALQIAKNGDFQLVHAKSGKTTISQGTATRSGEQLTLADPKGTKIVGTVKQTIADAFTLVIGSSTAVHLEFKRAK